MTVALGAIPAKRESVDSALSNQTIKDLETTRVVFFAGDDVGHIEKYEMPNVKGFGGLFLPHIKTLPKENKGMLYRCQFTPLRPAMITQPLSMLAPGDRENWQKGFTQSNAVFENGQWRDKVVNGFTQSDPEAIKRTGKFETKMSDHQVYKTRYPGHDVAEITKRSEPHGAGGVVNVDALMGATQDEIDAAQLFFFPNWNEIAAGTSFLPDTEQELREYINERIKAIGFECPIELRAKYTRISQAMLQSCTSFRQAYLQTFQKNEIIMKDSAAKGNTGASYHPRTEDAMKMLGYRRKDDIVSGDSSSVDRLAHIMEKKESGQSEAETKRMLLEERKQYVAEVQGGFRERDLDEEVRLGMKKAEVTPIATSGYIQTLPIEPQPEVVTTTTADPAQSYNADTRDFKEVVPQTSEVADTRICGAPTKAGSPCQRPILGDAVACSHHSE